MKKNCVSFFIGFIISTQVFAQSNQALWLSSTDTPLASSKKGRVDRGYIIPQVEATKDGAILHVHIYQNTKNKPVKLVLQTAISNGTTTKVIPLEILSDVTDNPTSYYSKRSFHLTYSHLNSLISRLVPGKTNLVVEPGTPFFVYARFNNLHQWGGPDRGGVFFMPVSSTTQKRVSPKSTARTTELDLAFPINTTLANVFNTTHSRVGLKVGGQIRSRVEGEGKYQILTETEFQQALRNLLLLANDSVFAKKILGKDWSISLETRYLNKDANGKLLMDKSGLPIPDPMVDTYYDNATYDAAKNDMAIRYRWTGGNKTGAWNFKQGMGLVNDEGIVYRTESAVDTTDNKPDSIKPYVDSYHPLNIFNPIRTIVKGSTPSDFFEPSVEINDTRYKFKLQHTNGLEIEVSLDNAHAKSLRPGNPKVIQFFQLEMDIAHLATQSSNVASRSNLTGLGSDLLPEHKKFLKSLDTKAFFDGTPSMHSESDLKIDSPLRKKHLNDFKLAQAAIVALRAEILGQRWYKGAQKYAVASYALGRVDETAVSKSVKELLKEIKGVEKQYAQGAISCRVSVAK